MNQIVMRHPELADSITVSESAVPIHMASGWVAVEESTPTAATATSKPKATAPAKDKE